MRVRIISYIVLFLFILFPRAEAEGANLLPNPGFEEGSGSEAYFWIENMWDRNPGATELLLDANQKHSGGFSACIINHAPNDARYKQEVNVKGDTYYKLSCWVRTEEVGTAKKGANLSVDGLLDTSRDIRGTNGAWEYIELYGKTRQDQATFTLTLGLGGYGSENTGKAWFDDVSVEELRDLPAGKTAVKLYTEDSAPSGTSKNANEVPWLVIAVLALSMIAISSVTILKTIKKPASRNGNMGVSRFSSALHESIPKKSAPDKRDFFIMASMTFAYLAIALINLGSLHVPKTYWQPAKPGESFMIDLGGQKSLSRIYYYQGLTERKYEGSKYRVEYADASGKFIPLATLEMDDFYKWKHLPVSVKTHMLRFIVDAPGGMLHEIGIFAEGSRKPVDSIRILERKADASDAGSIDHLFDEQSMIEYAPSFMTSTYFDEIYHARTAYEHIHRIDPYETTHPPLGKLFIASGILLFGMNPFGWRIVGTLFGAAMLPLMYLFGKKLFQDRFCAFCATFLMMFDFMHFAQTRIATIDVYGTFFVLLMYYFMYDYYVYKSTVLGFRASLRPLFLTGLFFGIGAACKWISVYAGGGLALLFFLTKLAEYRDYKRSAENPSSGKAGPDGIKHFFSDHVVKTTLCCVLFFVVVPAIIYILSYIPFMLVPGPGHGLIDGVLKNQADMFSYHSKLEATHAFSSLWWQWPILYKPIWYYSGSGLTEGMASSIVSLGNPAVWWLGILLLVPSVLIAVAKRDKKMAVVFTAMAFQYLPWVFVSRLVFIYHFFSTVPFLIFAIVYVFKYLLEKSREFRYTIYVYLAVTAILFVLFYPVLSGMEVSRTYIEHLKWFQSWYF